LKQKKSAAALADALSPPARGRGLKPVAVYLGRGDGWSPPARGRGLKHPLFDEYKADEESPPARGRGLKLVTDGITEEIQRRPPRGGAD